MGLRLVGVPHSCTVCPGLPQNMWLISAAHNDVTIPQKGTRQCTRVQYGIILVSKTRTLLLALGRRQTPPQSVPV